MRRKGKGGRETNVGVVFLVPVTQLERRSTNKRILCPRWLPYKLRRTLLLPLFVLKHTEDVVKPLQQEPADNGHRYTHSISCVINAVGKVLIAVLDSRVFPPKTTVVCFKLLSWNEIKVSVQTQRLQRSWKHLENSQCTHRITFFVFSPTVFSSMSLYCYGIFQELGKMYPLILTFPLFTMFSSGNKPLVMSQKPQRHLPGERPHPQVDTGSALPL